MSATELLKRVKALPAIERQKFVQAVLTLEEEKLANSNDRKRTVKWPDVEARARRIFGNRTLPNLILLERAESVY